MMDLRRGVASFRLRRLLLWLLLLFFVCLSGLWLSVVVVRIGEIFFLVFVLSFDLCLSFSLRPVSIYCYGIVFTFFYICYLPSFHFFRSISVSLHLSPSLSFSVRASFLYTCFTSYCFHPISSFHSLSFLLLSTLLLIFLLLSPPLSPSSPEGRASKIRKAWNSSKEFLIPLNARKLQAISSQGASYNHRFTNVLIVFYTFCCGYRVISLSM